jgi:hypothetical protein
VKQSLFVPVELLCASAEIKERIRKRYERERIKIEKLLTLGYTTSGDP